MLCKSTKLFFTWGLGGGVEGVEEVVPEGAEVLSGSGRRGGGVGGGEAAAVGPAVIIGSLDRTDYHLPPPPAAAPAPTDVARMSIGPPENAG